jgi:uncharacterized protein YbjT (DUF2867 family)
MEKDKVKVAVIAGATGMVGKQLMYRLIEGNTYDKVIVLVRSPFTIQHPKLEQLIVDYNRLDDLDLGASVGHAFCCLGTTMKKSGSKEKFYEVDFTFVHRFALWALKHKASTFLLVSANGANTQSVIYYSRVKAAIEEAIAQIKFESIYILRPSLLLGDRQEFRFGEMIAMGLSKIVSPLMLGTLKRYKPIESKSVALGMIRMASESRSGIHIIENENI